ncbi:ribulose-phosphate 3-epimerase [Candidatus Woesearchaeota archaeon]|nr:ribulose-phosphate 3-epimerase [Candidatus Woesearchaeota archaeon]
MEYEIIPSILEVRDDAQKNLDMIKDAVKSVHIDVMDGIFVDDKTFGVDEVVELNTDLRMIVHLMTVDPHHLVPEYALAGADTIIFHVETAKDPEATIKLIKKDQCRAGISLRPGTSLEKIKPFLDDLDIVLVMTVEPGRGGQEIMPDMLLRVKELRRIAPDMDIMVDGGIDENTIRAAKEMGANMFVAGSAIFGSKKEKNPVKEIEKLRSAIE